MHAFLMLDAYRTKKSLFKVESWFLSHVKRWLTKTNEATLEWVQNAVAQDKVKKKKSVMNSRFNRMLV
jgi:hypothetical protein